MNTNPQDLSMQLNALGGNASYINPMASMNTGIDPNKFSTIQDLFGGTNAAGASQMGYLTAGIGTASSLLNGYLGMKQYGLAKDQLKFSKESFRKNFDSQAKMVNSQLADRQKLRNYERPDLNEDVATYMSKYGVQ